MKKLVILGITNHIVVKLVEAINRHTPTYQLIGFITKEFDNDPPILGHPVIGGYEAIPALLEQHADLVFFNHINSPLADVKEAEVFLAQHDCTIVSLIHPDIDLGHVTIGENCLLSEGAVVGSKVTIGRHFTCRLHSTISHDVTIGDYVYVSPGVTVCGCTTLKNCADLGAGCTILPRLTIGENSIVGAGAVVTKDVPDNVTVVGVPAKIIKHHTP